ncbi:hypothetical protein GCM10023238_33610 [Streptomyces heliomycini]
MAALMTDAGVLEEGGQDLRHLPEGTASPTAGMYRGRTASPWLTCMTGAPVVPFAMFR